jgi:Tol biopolymer transport system component
VNGLALMRAQPHAGFQAPQRVFGPAVDDQWSATPARWSLDRRQLAVTGLPDPTAPDLPQAGVVDAATGRLVTAPGMGYAPALTADGQWLAYVTLRRDVGAALVLAPVGTLAAGEHEDAVTAADLRAEGRNPETMSLLHWAPDGQTLAFMAAGANESYLYTLDRATQRVTYIAGGGPGMLLPAGFSADSRYLAYFANSGSSPVLRLVTHDLATGAETYYDGAFSHLRRLVATGQPLTNGGAAWSPDGHRLIVSSQAGVFVFDPATGAVRWLTFAECGRVAWFDLPG